MLTQYRLYFKFADNGSYKEYAPPPRPLLYPTLEAARASTYLTNPAEAFADESEWQTVNPGTWFLNRKILDQMGRSSPWLIEEVQVPENDAERIELAANLGFEYGGYDGAHHKQWVIDQMLRIILGQEGYDRIVAETNADDDYQPWDTGIAP